MTSQLRPVALLMLAAACAKGARPVAGAAAAEPAAQARLNDVGPRLISNRGASPLAVYGERMTAGMSLHLGPPIDQDLPLQVDDPGHAYTRLPVKLALPAEQSEAVVEARLRGPSECHDSDDSMPKGPRPTLPGSLLPGHASLTVVNDEGFPDLTQLWVENGEAFAYSPTTQQLWRVDPVAGSAELAAGDPPPPRFSAGPTAPVWKDLAFDVDAVRNELRARSVAGEEIRWRAPVSAAPGPLLVAGDLVAVGCRDSGQVELFEPATGAPKGVIVPGPGTPIVGGSTKGFSQYVMGGTTPRALAWSPTLKRLFLASIGPDIGPNPQRMEVSMNGGVAVLDPATHRYVRHLGFGAGVPQALALDDAAGLLYVADVSLGVVRVLDARKLAASDAAAAKALIQTLPIPPPEGFPTIRPAADFGAHGRAGVELHSGPQALALSADSRTLYVLDRFTGTLAVVDVRAAAKGHAKIEKQIPIVSTLAQRERRLGEILFFADLGRSGMSCDACHVEGGPGGLLFAKTRPLRIYRSPSILGSRETPPYFIPASTFSLEQTANMVGGRNRYHNPDLTLDEIQRLARYTGELAFPPNPFLGPEGAPPEQLELPDGHRGRPRLGRELFSGKAACASCHPAPEFTTDQDPASRGHYLDVGTPDHFPLRLQWQDPAPPGMEVPSLIGAWAIFPMLSSGTAGFGLAGEQLMVNSRFPLRAVLEMPGKRAHGAAAALDPKERDDLLAYLMTL